MNIIVVQVNEIRLIYSLSYLLGPVEPRKAENPSYGIEDVPVTNCNNLSRCSLVNFSITCQNQIIT